MKKISWLIVMVIVFTSIVTFYGCKSTATVNAYDINITLNEDMSVDGFQTVTYINETDNVLNEILFNLHANAYRKGSKYPPENYLEKPTAFPNGNSYGDMTIKEVKVNGTIVNFTIGGEDQNVLIVPLINELYPDESVQIQMEYKIQLANVISRTGYNEKTINLANCYPSICAYDDGFYECLYYAYGDPYYNTCANYKVKVTLPNGYVLASSGKEVQRYNENDTERYAFEISNARSFAMVASKEFKIKQKSVDGVAVSYYYYDDDAPEESLAYAEKSLRYFSKTFGKYPFSTYAVVQTAFMQGGMEFASLVMISDSLLPVSIGEVIVHETAHQWWQVGVGNNEIEYGFLDESLAEYSVVMFYENHPEYSLTREALIKSAEQTYKIYCSVYEKLFGETDTSMLRSLNEFSSEYEYVNIAYIKGCIMYDYLRTTIGDEKFIDALSKYYSKYCFKQVVPDDLVGVFEKVGADANGFFESFFNGKVIL